MSRKKDLPKLGSITQEYAERVLKKLWPTPDSFSALANPPMGKEETGKNRHALKLARAIHMDDEEPTETSQLPLLPADSLVSLLVLPGSEKARMMTVGSGLKCLGSSVRSDPLGQCVRMLLASSTWASTIVYLTWRTLAMKSRRFLYQLVPSTPRTDGIESSLWHTPTMTANQLAPSMVERDAGSWGKMWPTPTQRDHKDTGDCENVEDNGLLGRVVNPSIASGSLNPQFIEWLQGFPNGWTDLELSETP